MPVLWGSELGTRSPNELSADWGDAVAPFSRVPRSSSRLDKLRGGVPNRSCELTAGVSSSPRELPAGGKNRPDNRTLRLGGLGRSSS